MTEDKFIVKSTNGPRYVVGCRRQLDKTKLKQGTRVALDMTTLTIMRYLPREVDPLVYNMSHEDPGDVSYATIGGLSEQIRELREVIELPLMNPELFQRVGITPPKGYDDRPEARDRSRSPERDAADGRVTGVVLRWNEKGFGFIKPDDGGEDIFCHFSSIEDGNILTEGAPVSFVKQWDDRKGKERAEKVTGGSSDPRAGKGVALRWNDKGFGFIKPDDGSEDIFCHFSAIKDGDSLVQGALVSFVKQWDERKSKERAEDVKGGTFVAGVLIAVAMAVVAMAAHPLLREDTAVAAVFHTDTASLPSLAAPIKSHRPTSVP
ncbi:MAG: hypothetical protein SGPRY_009262 [Prymnesium sp.]